MGEAGIFVEFLFFVIVWASRRFRPDYTERIVSIKFNLTMAHITFNAAASIKGWGATLYESHISALQRHFPFVIPAAVSPRKSGEGIQQCD